jgi:ankyrin repeat protein
LFAKESAEEVADSLGVVAVVDSAAREALSAELEEVFRKMKRRDENDYTDTISALLRAGADWRVLTKVDTTGKRIFKYVNNHNFYGMRYVLLLMDYGMPVNIQDWRGTTFLMDAARGGDEELVFALLEPPERADGSKREAADPNIVASYGSTALTGAANSARIIEALLRHGADPNFTDGWGKTGLMSNKRDSASVEALLRSGTDPNIADHHGRTALMLVENPASIEVLLRRGVDPNVVDHDGNTALKLTSDSACIRVLLRYGADPNIANNSGSTAMHYLSHDVGTRRILVDAGADVDVVDKYGFTPLIGEMARIIYGTSKYHQPRHERVAELLDLGADPMRKIPDGKNLLYLYKAHKYPPTVKLLLDAGVNPMETDSTGKYSALYFAVYEYGENDDDEAREMIIAAAKELDILAAQEIIRKAKWDKTAKHIAQEVSWLLPIIISLAYMGFSIVARQKIYRNKPQSNWVITVNAFIAGFIGGTIVVFLQLLLFIVLGVKDNFIRNIEGIVALIVGVITGVILAKKFPRETYGKNSYLYYSLSALTAALSFRVSETLLNPGLWKLSMFYQLFF